MAIIVELTQLSPTMEEGTLVKWSKKNGDHVEPGDVIAEVETDKAVMEMEAYDEGMFLARLIEEGDRIPIGAPLAILGEVGEDIHVLLEEAKEKLASIKAGGGPAPVATAAPPTAPVGEEKPAPVAAAASTPAQVLGEPPAQAMNNLPASRPGAPAAPDRDAAAVRRTGRVKASPLARKIAEDKNLDLGRVKGSGPGGRIVKADVLAHARGGSARGGVEIERRPDRKVEISGMRRVIAQRLHEAKTNIPHFYLTQEFDARPMAKLRKQLNADLAQENPEEVVKISYNDLIIKACALSLVKHPVVNSSWGGDHILEHGRVDVGVAVAIEGGLITPYIRNADQQSIISLAGQVHELANRARERKLKPQEYTEGTFTVSNLGMFGVTHFSAIINEPEAALMAIGGLVEKAIVENGELVPGLTMTVTLSCDHRVIDGAEGARFLQTFKNLMEHPFALLVK